jgi:hypothetical protein
VKITQVHGLRIRLEERIKALEKEKAMLLEEIVELKEVVVLNEKAKSLEDEVGKLKVEVKALREKIPPEILQEIMEVASAILADDYEGEECEEECQGCEEEEIV